MPSTHYRFFMVTVSSKDERYERLHRWTVSAGAQLEQEDFVYALLWHEPTGITRLIEVSFAPNGIAARTGVVDGIEKHRVRLESDKHAMTSWHCAPYDRLEDLLYELRQAHPEHSRHER